jgi:hypothetical protein
MPENGQNMKEDIILSECAKSLWLLMQIRIKQTFNGSSNTRTTSILKDQNVVTHVSPPWQVGERRGGMVIGFPTAYAINAYHLWSSEFEYRSWRGVLDKSMTCDMSVIFSTNKTGRFDITEILL